MNISKANRFALTPRLDKDIKHQMHSLISLVISSMFIMMQFASVAAAGPVSYTIHKTVIDVAGKGPAGNVTAAGDNVTYEIVVNNTAEVNLTNVTINDTLLGLLNVTNISVGNSWNYSGNYTVTQADIDNNGNGTGFIINNVTVTCNENTTANNATARAPIVSCNIVNTVSSINGNSTIGNVTAAGDIIYYQINVNNTAGMDLTNVTVTDPMIGLLNVTNLGIGSNETLYGNYTVTQADLNNNGNGTGFIINNATVRSDQLGSKNATVTTPIQQNANCTIDKTIVSVDGVLGGNVTAAGDIVAYQVNVTNIGNVDLYNVTVSDPLIGNFTAPISSLNNDTVLNVGETWTYTGNYTVTRADITNNDGNGLVNTASINCDQLGPKNDTVQAPIATSVSIEGIVTDVAGHGSAGNVTAAGDLITYQVNVTNNGITDLTNVTVNSSLTNLTEPTYSLNNDTVLNPGETWTYAGNYTVTQADLNNNGTVDGGLVKNATTAGNTVVTKMLFRSTEDSEAAGNGFIKNTVTFNSDQIGPKSKDTNVPVVRNPHYGMLKSVINPDESGDCIVNSPGDEIPYRIVVFNDGNVDLTGINVTDPMILLIGPSGDDSEQGILNPGEAWIYNGVHRLTQADINNGNGNINNIATVGSNELPEVSSDVSQPIEINADLSIQKSILGIDEAGDFMINNPGDVINYQIAVQNNGNVDLHNVHVTDSLIDDLSGPTGDTSNPGVLNPGETWVFKGDYVVTQADIGSIGEGLGFGIGFITNTATVSCNEHPSESSSIQVPIVPIPSFGSDENSGSKVPVADFSASVKSGYAPLSVQFTDKSQNAVAWNWDFNSDGTVDSTTQSPAYVYNNPGTYVAKLTVRDINGTASEPATETINVLKTTSSSGSSGKSSGIATLVSSSSSGSTGTASITQSENNTSAPEQISTPAEVEQTPVQKAASTPAKPIKKTPGFEIFSGLIGLFAVVLYLRKRE